MAPYAQALLSLAGLLLVTRVQAQTELLLVVGEERSLRTTHEVVRAIVDLPESCEIRLEDGGKTVVLLARRPAVSGLKLFDAAGGLGAEYVLRIFANSQELLRRDVEERLKGLAGVVVEVDGDRVVMRGTVRSLDNLNQVREVGRDFPELLDLVAYETAPEAPLPRGAGVPVRVGDLTLVAPDSPGWAIRAFEGGFRAEHPQSGARIEARIKRLPRGMAFKEAASLIVAEFGGEREGFLRLETGALRFLHLGEHEASLSEWTDGKGSSGYLLIATATPFPINLEYALIEASFPPAGAPPGEAFFAEVLRSLGERGFSPRPGIPYVHARGGFFLRYPGGWTVGGETGEAAGFYQNPDNRPVVNLTVERLPGSYPGAASEARAAAVLFQRARARGPFRVESESAAGGEPPWQRRIVFEGARPLRQAQAVWLRNDRAYALIYTAEPELFSIHEAAFQQALESFRALGEVGERR